MLRNILRNAILVSRRSESTVAKQKWDIHVGVLVERLPIISKKFTDLELEVKKTLEQIEFENSLKSDHEMRKEKDKIEQELLKSGKMEHDLDADTRTLQTAQDYEDLNQEELAKFHKTIASRVLPPEVENNRKNVSRKMDESLLLICEQNIDGTNAFVLPQDKWNEGETLRQTAERIVKDQLGEGLKAKIYGNAPCGFYKYKYKSTKPNDSVGAKVFFYRAKYGSGEIENKKLTHEWVNQAELAPKVRKSYFDSVSRLLV